MKRKNISAALLALLGLLPKRVEREQTTMMIVSDTERITVNELLKAVLKMLDEATNGREEEEIG